MAPKKEKDGEKEKDGIDQGGKAAALERENENLTVELKFYKDKVSYLKGDIRELQERAEAAEEELRRNQVNNEETLRHKRRENEAKDSRIKSLNETVGELKQAVSDRDARISSLEEECKRLQGKLEDNERLHQEKSELEEIVQKQEAALTEQQSELERVRTREKATSAHLEQARTDVDALSLRAKDQSKLAVLFGEPWLLCHCHRRLQGEVPAHREGSCLVLLGSKLLAFHGGGTMGDDGLELAAGGGLRILNLDRLRWEAPAGNATVDVPDRAHHSALPAAANRLAIFGGIGSKGPLNDIKVFNIDTERWTMPLGRVSACPRYGYASCVSQKRMYIFGGCTIDPSSGKVTLMDDLCFYDFESSHVRNLPPLMINTLDPTLFTSVLTLQWTFPATTGSSPAPLRGAAICTTHDSRLYLVGGFDGSQHTMAIAMLELDRLAWVKPNMTGRPPPPRENHSAMMCGDYLIIAGGTDGNQLGPPHRLEVNIA